MNCRNRPNRLTPTSPGKAAERCVALRGQRRQRRNVLCLPRDRLLAPPAGGAAMMEAPMQDFINRQADATLAAPGETPMERLNARLNDASEA